jgi:hypothetical protein
MARSFMLRLVAQCCSLMFAVACGLGAWMLLEGNWWGELGAALGGTLPEDHPGYEWSVVVTTLLSHLTEGIAKEWAAVDSPAAAGLAVAFVSYLAAQCFTTVVNRAAGAVLYCALWQERQARATGGQGHAAPGILLAQEAADAGGVGGVPARCGASAAQQTAGAGERQSPAFGPTWGAPCWEPRSSSHAPLASVAVSPSPSVAVSQSTRGGLPRGRRF